MKERKIEKHKYGWAVVEIERAYGMVFKETITVYKTKAEALAAL